MENDVKAYYDQNTNLFLKLSGNEKAASIHQPLWLKDTTDRNEALNNSNRIVTNHIAALKLEKPVFLDLGCGVGGTVFYILNQLPNAYGYGITISSKQAKMSKKLAQKDRCNERSEILEGDFLNIPKLVPVVDFAFAIESFVHSTNARKFLQEAYRKLKPGGHLLIIDDFLAKNLHPTKKSDKILTDFKSGWMLSSLIDLTELQSISSDLGFELIETDNYTHFLPIDSLRDKLISLYLRSFRWLLGHTSYFKSQMGGDARQTALKRGLIIYAKVLLRKN